VWKHDAILNCSHDKECSDLPYRRGPEGRPPNVSPARKGWVSIIVIPSAVGAAPCALSCATPRPTAKRNTLDTCDASNHRQLPR
jgi:hypothetical protein